LQQRFTGHDQMLIPSTMFLVILRLRRS